MKDPHSEEQPKEANAVIAFIAGIVAAIITGVVLGIPMLWALVVVSQDNNQRTNIISLFLVNSWIFAGTLSAGWASTRVANHHEKRLMYALLITGIILLFIAGDVQRMTKWVQVLELAIPIPAGAAGIYIGFSTAMRRKRRSN